MRRWGEEDTNYYDIGYKMSRDELVALYQEKLRKEPVSDKHVYSVGRYLTNSLKTAEDMWKVRPQNWGTRTADRFVELRRAQGKSDSTVRGDIVALKTFFRWLWKAKYFEKNLMEFYDLPPIKLQRDIPLIADDIIDGWLQACNEYYRDPDVHGAKGLANNALERLTIP